NIHDAKTNLSKLLEAVARGEEVVIARAGKPVARLVAIPEKREPRKGGFWKGQVWMAPDEEMKEVDEEIARLFNESKLDF
ncbi:MAG: type II toxin-antitoxin system Phd/YefM family antitoxin, partial [Gammaproteobacteria bacterium]|nr:type II toxin-antitoxin system Phd/YefM family antitoxin [Gammaproteobacteria bacterium]